jgi:hypothetical protein
LARRLANGVEEDSVAHTIRQIEYFYTMVRDQPGEAYQMLSRLGAAGVNLLAFNAVPAGLDQIQLVLFPESVDFLAQVMAEKGLELDGPHHALLIQGDDELGALAEIHRLLFEAGVNVSASSGVADGRGSYGYVIYLREDDVTDAAAALGI